MVYYSSKKLKKFLDYIPGTTEYRLRIMEEEKEFSIPECPVTKLTIFIFI